MAPRGACAGLGKQPLKCISPVAAWHDHLCLAMRVPALMQIADAPKPSLAYLTDPSQNPAADLLKGFTPSGSSVGTVTGPDFISYAPCLVR
jgi:hypothetical protein